MRTTDTPPASPPNFWGGLRGGSGFLRRMIHAGRVDGKLSTQAKRLLYDYCERMYDCKADLRHVIARERKQTYQRSRQLQRQRKASGRTASA